MKFLNFHDWLKIDHIENERGKAQKKLKMKIQTKQEIFDLLNK